MPLISRNCGIDAAMMSVVVGGHVPSSWWSGTPSFVRPGCGQHGYYPDDLIRVCCLSGFWASHSRRFGPIALRLLSSSRLCPCLASSALTRRASFMSRP